MNVTTKDFKAYLEVQLSSKYNMLSTEAQLKSGLDVKTYVGILRDYRRLFEKYKDSEECKYLLEEHGY